jgi:hypothetical protein
MHSSPYSLFSPTMQSPILPPISASTARSSSLQFHAAAISSVLELVKVKVVSNHNRTPRPRKTISSAKNELRHAHVKLDAR